MKYLIAAVLLLLTQAQAGTNIRGQDTVQQTTQVLTSGSSATYTTPRSAIQLRIRMCGGGGGGGAGDSTHNGAAGTDTIFNSIHATAGSGGVTRGAGGAGGSGGSGSAFLRISGQHGQFGINASNGGLGGSSPFGGGGDGPTETLGNPGTGYCSGGGGGSDAAATGGGGGGAGEYVELIINRPSATYTYTVGGGGAGGSNGTDGGGSGTGGVIYLEEINY